MLTLYLSEVEHVLFGLVDLAILVARRLVNVLLLGLLGELLLLAFLLLVTPVRVLEVFVLLLRAIAVVERIPVCLFLCVHDVHGLDHGALGLPRLRLDLAPLIDERVRCDSALAVAISTARAFLDLRLGAGLLVLLRLLCHHF